MITAKQGLEIKMEDTKALTWEVDVPFYQQHHLWHAGEVCSIKSGEYTFVIEAMGDVRFTLIDKALGTTIFYVKDRSNVGQLSSELLKYINSDNELEKALNGTHDKYKALLEDSNWWEYSVTKDGEYVDVNWTIDAERIIDAIAEVKSVMPEILADLILEDLPF